LLGIQPVGPCKHLPINMTGALALIVQSMFSKLNRKSVVGRFMKAGNEAFNELLGQ